MENFLQAVEKCKEVYAKDPEIFMIWMKNGEVVNHGIFAKEKVFFSSANNF